MHLGLNPIYIIGCDHYYVGEENAQDGELVAHSSSNHFHPNYRSAGEKVNPAPIEQMNCAYSHARAYCDQHNIRIFNATRGGHLEIFERIDFEDALQLAAGMD